MAPTILPALVPTIRSGLIPFSTKVSITPIWAIPRNEPPLSTRAMTGRSVDMEPMGTIGSLKAAPNSGGAPNWKVEQPVKNNISATVTNRTIGFPMNLRQQLQTHVPNQHNSYPPAAFAIGNPEPNAADDSMALAYPRMLSSSCELETG